MNRIGFIHSILFHEDAMINIQDQYIDNDSI